MNDISIVWFRRDLRLSDNEIVSLATKQDTPVIFVFTLDPWFFGQQEIGKARVRFLVESLIELDKNLKRLGSKLHILTGESSKVIMKLIDKCQANNLDPALYFNRDIQVRYGLERDEKIRKYCENHAVSVHEGQSYFLSYDQSVMDNWYEHYYRYQETEQWRLPTSIMLFDAKWLNDFEQIETNNLMKWAEAIIGKSKSSPLFKGGEINAQRTLESFLRTRYHGYHWKLSQPYLARHGATSQLSPHIAFGTISTRQVNTAAYNMKQRLKRDRPEEVKTLAAFLSRLRWRDSFTQRLYFFPDLIWKNQYEEFDEMYVDEPLTGQKLELFEAWKAGKTGFPMLDASMRQLASDGWMNFRMRAQAVTMLCIVFGVSWHHGARYFMQQLVDGDVAINHWQWQMQAGITNPLSPIFRIYNPTKNFLERDPRLKYVHEWLPEYRNYATHDEILSRAKPIVDFDANKKLYGDQISRIRKSVRERLEREGSSDFHDAKRLYASTSRLQKQYVLERKNAKK